jgi:hypothetical protein
MLRHRGSLLAAKHARLEVELEARGAVVRRMGAKAASGAEWAAIERRHRTGRHKCLQRARLMLSHSAALPANTALQATTDPSGTMRRERREAAVSPRECAAAGLSCRLRLSCYRPSPSSPAAVGVLLTPERTCGASLCSQSFPFQGFRHLADARARQGRRHHGSGGQSRVHTHSAAASCRPRAREESRDA